MYRKPTNKNDFIHFSSGHNFRVKTGVVLGFYLRAFRICSEKFIVEELDYIKQTFRNHGYPLGLLTQLQQKAKNIKSRPVSPNQNNGKKVFVSVPASPGTDAIASLVGKNVKICSPAGTLVKHLVKNKQRIKTHKNKNSAVYKIPCGACNKSYIGETFRGTKTRVEEHKADLRHHRTTNAIVRHVDKAGHLPNWNKLSILCTEKGKQERLAIEAAFIHLTPTINGNIGKIKICDTVAKLLIEHCS